MPRPGSPSVVLVTGFPSLHARKMAFEILEREPSTFVHAVVLSKFADKACAAIAELPKEQAARIELVEGDAAAMDLGLSGAEFKARAREVDRIHHVAHVSYLGVDDKTAEANVHGAAEIVEFARASPELRCLVVHSTANVAGNRTGVVFEEELDAGQSFRNVVERTRMRAEVIARRAMRDLPIAVVRPTTLVGDSETGEVDRLDGVYLLVLLVVGAPQDFAIPFPGKGEAPLHLVPLDFVVRAAHAIGLSPAAPGKTFHLADSSPLSARRVFDVVARAVGRGASRGYIPANVAKAVLRTPGIERFVRSPRAFVEELTRAVRYDTSNADRLLGPMGITCPPFEAYADKLVSVVQDHVRARQKKREDAAGAEVDDPAS